MDKQYKLTEELVLADIDDELVCMSIKSGAYHSFGPVGSEILSRIQTGKKPEEIIAELPREYDVAEEVCAREVGQFMEKLLALEIIEPA